MFIELHDDHRHVVFKLGVDSYFHIFDAPDSPHTIAGGELLQRGHLDHTSDGSN